MEKRVLLAGVAGIALIAATTVSPGRTRYFVQSTPPNAEPLRALGRSHISLIADLVWIRAIGVTVNLRVPSDGLSLLLWCNLVADLDPKFLYPYLFGGLLAPMSSAKGHHNVAEASALLRRGMENVPGDYRLPLYLAFNQLQVEHDFRGAAATLQRGARIPGAPVMMGQLATRLLAQTDDFAAADALVRELEGSTHDPEVKALFERRAVEIERDRRVAELERAVSAFRSQRGTLPQTLMQLLSEGFLTELSVDPISGREFILEPDGRVRAPSGERLKAHFQEDP
jgi:hypothetical protein